MGRRLLAAGAAVAALWIAAPAAQAQAGGSCTLEPSDSTQLVGARTYELHVPAGLSGPSVPLLVTMHGFSSWGGAHEINTRWSEFADANGFIVAYPNGIANAWYFNQGSYDVDFLRNLVAHVAERWCVDPDRVYASGHSNGAFMAQRLACDAHDVFASVTEYAGGDPEAFRSPCSPSRGVSVGLFHGDADAVVAHSSGEQARNRWVARNGCSTTPSSEPVSDGVVHRYGGCRDGAEVLWRSYAGQGHLWPEGARGDDIRSRMWSFLSAHPRP